MQCNEFYCNEEAINYYANGLCSCHEHRIIEADYILPEKPKETLKEGEE